MIVEALRKCVLGLEPAELFTFAVSVEMYKIYTIYLLNVLKHVAKLRFWSVTLLSDRSFILLISFLYLPV